MSVKLIQSKLDPLMKFFVIRHNRQSDMVIELQVSTQQMAHPDKIALLHEFLETTRAFQARRESDRQPAVTADD